MVERSGAGDVGSVRAELATALEQGDAGQRRAGAFLARVATRLRRRDRPLGPAAVQAATLTRRATARFGFDDDVAEVFVALAAAIADEAAELYADELRHAPESGDRRFDRVRGVADAARVRREVSSSFTRDIVPDAASALAAFVPGLALRRPLRRPAVVVGAAVAGGLAESALAGTTAVPAALALSVVIEAAETYAQSSVLVTKFRAHGHEPSVGDVLDELAALSAGGILGRGRSETAAVLRTAALPRVAATLERRVGLRVASLATVIGPALIEGGLATWGVVKASRHRLRRGGELPPAPPPQNDA